VIMKNGYSSATGTQELPSSPQHSEHKAGEMSMEKALQGVGVRWIRTVDNYRVGAVAKTLKEAMSTDYQGLKVIVADGECQLERQRRLRPQTAKKLVAGERVVRVKYGVDEDTCTGDHSCIRLSGCPTLTLKDNPDPLRSDPVATVIDGCVGCGLCGENAHAAVLCPSFYRAEVIQNPNLWDRMIARVRGLFV
jgi:indolepyruvate ferredoxin oxidoreductase, alpha subunit